MADAAVEADDRELHSRPSVKPDTATHARPAFDGADIAALSQRYSPAQVRDRRKERMSFTGLHSPSAVPPTNALHKNVDRIAGFCPAYTRASRGVYTADITTSHMITAVAQGTALAHDQYLTGHCWPRIWSHSPVHSATGRHELHGCAAVTPSRRRQLRRPLPCRRR